MFEAHAGEVFAPALRFGVRSSEKRLQMKLVEGEEHSVTDLGSDDKQRIEQANQIFLRLKKQLHDRERQFTERDLEEAAQSARWLTEITERRPDDLDRAYEDALAGSDLDEEDKAYLRDGVEKAGGFSSFVRRNLRGLGEAAPDEEETGEPAGEMTGQDLACGAAAGLLAGGIMMGNLFYLGFAVGMSRKAGCW